MSFHFFLPLYRFSLLFFYIYVPNSLHSPNYYLPLLAFQTSQDILKGERYKDTTHSLLMAQVNWQWDLRECCVDVGVAYNIFCVYCVLCDLVQIGCVQQWQRHRGGFEGFFFFFNANRSRSERRRVSLRSPRVRRDVTGMYFLFSFRSPSGI